MQRLEVWQVISCCEFAESGYKRDVRCFQDTVRDSRVDAIIRTNFTLNRLFFTSGKVHPHWRVGILFSGSRV
jgi:hypothetical protein